MLLLDLSLPYQQPKLKQDLLNLIAVDICNKIFKYL